METLLIGIDGACLPVLDELFERTELPALESLVERGTSGPLESQIPPWTASAWPSLYTGTNPGKHGVYGFLNFDGYDWRVVNASDVHEYPLWELLDRQGLSSVVVNVPVTAPPRPFDGALVSGYVGPDDPTCHPEGILDELQDELGRYRVYPHRTDAAPNEIPRRRLVDDFTELVRMRGAAFRHLTDRITPAFGFLQFQVTDTVFHRRPGDWAAVEAVYEAVDRQTRETISACDPATTIVASDHGIGRYDGYMFHVNEFLRRQGFVQTNRGGGGMPSWGPLRDRMVAERDGTDESKIASTAIEQLAWVASIGSNLGITSQRVGALLGRVGLTEIVASRVPDTVVRSGTEQVDFASSSAYMRARTELGIRLNVVGRDPDGVVPPEEYESTRRAVIECLEAVEAPDGTEVFEDVAPREEHFRGPEVDDAVDIVTVPNRFESMLSAKLLSNPFSECETWNHKREGVVAVRGRGVDEESSIADAHLFDVAPTVLSTLDVPPSARMDGATLAPVASRPPQEYGLPQRRKVTHGSSDETDMEVSIEDHLRSLGYLERD
jgi:predicted AlkP superfamily phosphohydrolase/phosphomutase